MYLSKAISGGEKKRLCIALEILNNSRVLILDEPTSGLDSDKALKVVKVLQKLCREEGTTAIMSVHQPSYRLLQTLDRIMVLSSGRTVFQGDTSEMVGYLSKLGVRFSLKSNICDSFML